MSKELNNTEVANEVVEITSNEFFAPLGECSLALIGGGEVIVAY
jgi:hypothetical protein